MGDTTKATLYISALFVIAIFSVLIVNISIVSANKLTLDDESIEFVNLYSDIYEKSNLTVLSNTQIGEITEYDLYGTLNSSGEIISTDQFSIPKYTQSSLTATPNFFKLIYNFPTILFVGVGFSDFIVFSSYINIFSYIVYISLLIVTVKMLFNGGNS